MNVLGKNERSWRKARKRAVSPIIATILLVAITVVLAAVLYVLISGLTGGGTGGKPIGGAFNAGNAVASQCPSGDTYALATGPCTYAASPNNHYIYTLTVESSSVNFGSVLFEVKNSAGTIITTAAANGFSIVNIAGNVVAQSTASATLAMTATFQSYAATNLCNSGPCSAATSLTSIYTIVIDMGTVSPSGLGYSFVTVGTGSYSGTTSVGLP